MGNNANHPPDQMPQGSHVASHLAAAAISALGNPGKVGWKIEPHACNEFPNPDLYVLEIIPNDDITDDDIPDRATIVRAVAEATSRQVVLIVSKAMKVGQFENAFDGMDVMLCGNKYSEILHAEKTIILPSISSRGPPVFLDACMVACHVGGKTIESYLKARGNGAYELLIGAGLLKWADGSGGSVK